MEHNTILRRKAKRARSPGRSVRRDFHNRGWMGTLNDVKGRVKGQEKSVPTLAVLSTISEWGKT
jgi:hypothetical protein